MHKYLNPTQAFRSKSNLFSFASLISHQIYILLALIWQSATSLDIIILFSCISSIWLNFRLLKDTYISQYFVNIHSSVSHIGKTSNNTLVLSLITLRSDYFCFTHFTQGPSVKKTLKQLASVDLFHLKVLIADLFHFRIF